MPTCKYCKCDKPNREMATWGGSVTETCLECKEARRAAKKGGGVKVDPPALADAAPAAAPASTDSLDLSVEGSIGFTASVDEQGRLVVAQDNSSRAEDPDNITLTRAEAKTLFARFAKWADAA